MLEHFLAVLLAALAGFLPAHSLSYVAPPPLAAAPRATILFGGDMMFDRTIRTTGEEKGGDYVFACLDPVFQDNDLVVANLEGPITSTSSRSVGSKIGSTDNFVFTFPPSTAQLLARHGIRLVNIGNNHIMNFSRAGLLETKRYLTEAGVGYFGDPDAAENDKVARISIHGIPFSFVNWSDWTSDKTDHTIAQVREEAQSGRVVVVYTHWGVEYATSSPVRVHDLAHEFVKAGASLIVGSHPHVVQEHEKYNSSTSLTAGDADIYYSLGNLIFDQYWNDAVSHGLMLQVTFAPDGTHTIKEIPVVLQRDRRTCPVE